jgi:DNA-binding CsgD family transcriptional regulator
MQPVGALPRGLLAAFPNGVFTAALTLAAGTTFCLWRFRRLLLEMPELWALSRNEGGKEAGAEATEEPDPEKLHAFAAGYGLTKREIEVLRGVVRIMDMDAISQELGVSIHTARFHLRGLLSKTTMASRQRLQMFYSAWKP